MVNMLESRFREESEIGSGRLNGPQNGGLVKFHRLLDRKATQRTRICDVAWDNHSKPDTILLRSRMGLDHESVTYHDAGRDFR